MTEAIVSDNEDYSSSSARDYNGNLGDLETTVAESYSGHNPKMVKPTKKNWDNHSAYIMRRNGEMI